MLSLRVSKPKLWIPWFFFCFCSKKKLYSNHWPLGLLSEHCIAAGAQSIYRPWETVMELCTDGTLCIPFFLFFFTRHWAMAAIHRGSQMQTKMYNTNTASCYFTAEVINGMSPLGGHSGVQPQRQEDSIIHRSWDFLCDCLSLKELFLFWTE